MELAIPAQPGAVLSRSSRVTELSAHPGLEIYLGRSTRDPELDSARPTGIRSLDSDLAHRDPAAGLPG